MSWMDAQDQKRYAKLVDVFLKARSAEIDARRAKTQAEEKLITMMGGDELENIHRKDLTIHLEVPDAVGGDDGDAYLSVSFRSALDLG